MKIATIARCPENSPNMTTNDAAILECVTKELTALGAEVVAIDEAEDIPEGIDTVCHMSRSPLVLERLKNAEENGIAIINTPDAVNNCSRVEFLRILEKNGIPQPHFHIIENTEELDNLQFPAWIKRGNGWSCHKDDVCYATNRNEAVEAIANMRQRGIGCIVYTNHCEGDIIKFYGIGENFFTDGYPNVDKTKFGLEKINGEAKHYPFNADALRDIATKAAKAVGIDIYGGDCIINRNGKISLIDLNDFPSFSAVREEAAKEIAGFIMKSK